MPLAPRASRASRSAVIAGKCAKIAQRLVTADGCLAVERCRASFFELPGFFHSEHSRSSAQPRRITPSWGFAPTHQDEGEGDSADMFLQKGPIVVFVQHSAAS